MIKDIKDRLERASDFLAPKYTRVDYPAAYREITDVLAMLEGAEIVEGYTTDELSGYLHRLPFPDKRLATLLISPPEES